MKQGADAYLTKPYTQEQLVQSVKSVMKVNR
jgi:DNA-binding response OmpR family regulator